MRLLRFVCVMVAVACFIQWTASARADDPWADFRYLVGEWVGDGSQGSGNFSHQFELDEHILVRRNHADLPASQGRPAVKHDDLVIFYRPEPGKPMKAVFFDNEGHFIDYDVSVSSDKKVIMMTGAPSQNKPRFRFSYTKQGDGKVVTKFEIAPPGQPEKFRTYLEGVCKRK